MLPYRSVAVILLGALAADQPPALRVLRATPLYMAQPSAVIAVTFDRPVAGGIDRTTDPAGILTVSPAVDGEVDWRDPVTLRLRPRSPLPAGAVYTVTVHPSFAALDGSRLAEPYTFSFRVTGPRVLTGLPAGPGQEAKFLGPGARFDLVATSAADPAVVAGLAYLELGKTCAGESTVQLRVTSQRSIAGGAPWQLREAGGWERDRSLDSLRRVITLEPVAPLPRACAGALVVPSFLDRTSPGDLQRWSFATYGALRIAGAQCAGGTVCPTGPIVLRFSTPVTGAEVLRRVTILPATAFTVSDTVDARPSWNLWAELKPRTGYLISVDPALTDRFGQRLTGNPRVTAVTTGYAPDVSYTTGKLTIERDGPRTLPVTYVNVDTLEVVTARVPDSLEGRLLSRGWYAWDEEWEKLAPSAVRRRFTVASERDRHGVYGVPFDAPTAGASLFAVRISSPAIDRSRKGNEGSGPPVALVQVTDLGVHAKIGWEEGSVWVTGVRDGAARPGVDVRVRDQRGRVLGQGSTDERGLARFGRLRRFPKAEGDDEHYVGGFEGYVEARQGVDRAVIGVTEYDPDLSPWQFNVAAAWGTDQLPAAAAVFTERGIYRPGDSVFAKAIVRTGLLGALTVPAPADSARLVFEDRDGGTLTDRVIALSRFGTGTEAIRLPAGAPLGEYAVTVALRRQGEWREIGRAGYRVAEYRAPEFLVAVTADTAARLDGDTLVATIGARYLFGAPMARAGVTWSVRQRALSPWDVDLPGTDGYLFLERGWWYDEFQNRRAVSVSAAETDSLDPTGQLTIRAPIALTTGGNPARVSVEAVVTDVNRQTVYGSAAITAHPAAFYVGVKPRAGSYFWSAGTPQVLDLIAVRPGGGRVSDVAVRGALIRREWHQVRRENDGYAQLVGEWVADTVDRCVARTADAGVACRLTPAQPGSYTLRFTAADPKGRAVATSFHRWVTGPGWVPWADESRFRMDVVPDRSRYAPGDTATVLFASPFTDAEAWVTVEREGVIDERRLRLTDGATTLRFPITEAWAPNAFVSIVVARGRSAEPGPLDDPGRPTIRVGYAEIRVTPERKRLEVRLAADRNEYRPGDRAVLTATVRDAGRGRRSEVTLWAVDEGVLSLTGYRTPDPLDLLYQPRGLGLRLGSNLATVVPQVAQGDKGRRAGGGGGDGATEILRSRFRSTAFFLGSVETDSTGVGTATVTLPDNLTTFRVMAVAVTAGDRFGSGELPLLVTRPLLARAALPRFVRPGDRLTAGVVVNHRTGGTPSVRVDARADGIEIEGSRRRTARLEAGRGRELRFDFLATPGDSATFRFDVRGGGDRDAVRLAIPIRPVVRPRVTTIAGTLLDTATIRLEVAAGTDPAASALSLSIGASPLALLEGYADDLRIYPYYCSEQVASIALPLVALYQARREAGPAAGDTTRLRADLDRTAALLSRRLRDDGGIGLWSRTDWTSPWLTAHAGMVLLSVRAAGIPVADTVLRGIAGYLTASLAREQGAFLVASVNLRATEVRSALREKLAVAEYLSRAGARNRALENELLRRAGQLAPADRMALARIVADGGNPVAARRLLEPLWAVTRVEGRTATLPDSTRDRSYFESSLRPVAELLRATLAVDPAHRLLGPLFEAVVSRGRQASWWNTQDYAAAVKAVGAWQRRFPPADARGVRIRSGRKVVLAAEPGTGRTDSTVALDRLTGRRPGPLTLRLEATGTGAPVYYYLTLRETPATPPVAPEDRGFVVERWYEDAATGAAITSATEGDLVRVRLRVTVPVDRSFVVLDDPLPAGLEAIDLRLRTTGGVGGPGNPDSAGVEPSGDPDRPTPRWMFGSWDAGWWSPFDHRELRDDRVVYAARALWAGTYTASYLVRATTPGVFQRPQTHAEEMYNPAVFGRSEGGVFQVRARGAR